MIAVDYWDEGYRDYFNGRPKRRFDGIALTDWLIAGWEAAEEDARLIQRGCECVSVGCNCMATRLARKRKVLEGQ